MAKSRSDKYTAEEVVNVEAPAKGKSVTVQIRGNQYIGQKMFCGVMTFAENDPMLRALAGEYTIIEER